MSKVRFPKLDLTIMPSKNINISELEIPESFFLADPASNWPGKDLLFGAEIFLELIKADCVNLPNSKLI